MQVIIKILMCLFSVRPIIDLFYETSIAGINVAGFVAIFTIFLMILFFLAQKELTIPAVFFILLADVAIITILNASSISDWDNTLRIISALAILLVVAPNINMQQFEKMLRGFMLATLIPIFFSYLQLMGILEEKYWDYVSGMKVARATGGYAQPSVLTRFLVFGLLYALYFLFKYKGASLKHRFSYYIYCVLNLSALFISYHRTGYVLSAMVVFLFFFMEYKQQFIIRAMPIAIVGCLVFVLMYQLEFFVLDLDGFKTLFSLDLIGTFNDDGTFNLVLRGRGPIIQAVINAYKNSPMYLVIFGVGVDYNPFADVTLGIADMDFLRIWWNYGLLGLSIWFAMIFKFIGIAIEARKHTEKHLSRIAIITVLVFLVFGLTIEAMVTPNFMYHVYLVLGFAYYESKRNRASTLTEGQDAT